MTVMKNSFTAAAIQMNSGDEVAANLARAGELLAQAAAGGAVLAALPEFFALIAADEHRKLAIKEQDNSGPIQDFLAAAAARHRMYIVGGALPIDAGNGRVFAACPLYAPDGARLARYDKMHLFRFSGKHNAVDETMTITRGDKVVAVDTPLGRLGLAVCYDLRFAEFFHAMQTPDIIVIPSAFTAETGAAHWKPLLRARAIENMAHVIAPAQAGEHPGGRKTFGNSMIIDGWGRVLSAASNTGDEVVFASIDGAERARQRRRLPALNHRLLGEAAAV